MTYEMADVAQLVRAPACGAGDSTPQTPSTSRRKPISKARSSETSSDDPADPLLTELLDLFGKLSEGDKSRVLGFAQGLIAKLGASEATNVRR